MGYLTILGWWTILGNRQNWGGGQYCGNRHYWCGGGQYWIIDIIGVQVDNIYWVIDIIGVVDNIGVVTIFVV